MHNKIIAKSRIVVYLHPVFHKICIFIKPEIQFLNKMTIIYTSLRFSVFYLKVQGKIWFKYYLWVNNCSERLVIPGAQLKRLQ